MLATDMWNEVVVDVLKACLCLRETTKIYHIYLNARQLSLKMTS